jgi:ketosteroid isomerase-like protein
MSEDFRASFLPRHDAAHAKFVNGDPDAWAELWSDCEPVSILGGFGYVSVGWDTVAATIRKASSRLSNGTGYRNQVEIAESHGDFAYTVSIEHTVASLDGAPPRPTELRVTQIYRLEQDRWRIAHRHGDIIRPEYGLST